MNDARQSGSRKQGKRRGADKMTRGNRAEGNTARGGQKGERTTRLVDGSWQQRQTMEHVVGGGDYRGFQGQCVGSSA